MRDYADVTITSGQCVKRIPELYRILGRDLEEDRTNSAEIRITPYQQRAHKFVQDEIVVGKGATTMLAEYDFGSSRKVAEYELQWVNNGAGKWLGFTMYYPKNK